MFYFYVGHLALTVSTYLPTYLAGGVRVYHTSDQEGDSPLLVVFLFFVGASYP